MSAQRMPATETVEVEESSTNIFVRMKNQWEGMAWVQRNKKTMALCLLVWIGATVAYYFISRSDVQRIREEFYQVGVSMTQELAEKIGPSLLENDVLALNIAVGELEGTEGLLFAAIVNYEGITVAHTDPERTNSPFASIKNRTYIDTAEEISIEEGTASGNEEIVSFSATIEYAETIIGKVYLGLSGSDLFDAVNRGKRGLVLVAVVSLLILSLIVFVIDRISAARAKRREKAMEGMTQMGPYILIEKIARGGMAELFLADYVSVDGFRKTVAVKRVLPHLAQSPEFVKMFIREAKLAALLSHPNIAQVIDFGKIENAYYISMEYISGRNLAEIMAEVEGGMPVDQTVFIVSRVCLGLKYSHAKRDDKSGEPLNIVHRDISPQNILVSFQGEVKISDFGISTATAEPSFTRGDVIRGKLAYLSPEQVLAQKVDHQADLYALGIVFYEMLSGERLYKFSSDLEAIRSIPEIETDPIKTLREDIPEELNHIVMKCLEKDRKLRYQNAQEMLHDLTQLKRSLHMTYDGSSLADFMNGLFGQDRKD